MFYEVATARVLRDAMRPIWRQLSAARTVSVGKLGALGYPARREPTTASTLAVVPKVGPQSVATAVRALESLDPVTRTLDSTDGRRIWIELTVAACEKLAHERATGLRWLKYAIAERLTLQQKRPWSPPSPSLRKLMKEALIA